MATKSIKLPNRTKITKHIHEAAGTKTVTKGNPPKPLAVPTHGSGGK